MMGEEQSLLKAALDMYQAQYTATDRLWGYFSAVSLALVAYTISSIDMASFAPLSVEQLQHYYFAVVVAITLATLLLAWYRGRKPSTSEPAA